MDDVVVKVDNVSKDFKYKSRSASSIKSLFTGLFNRSEAFKEQNTQHALKKVSFEIKKGEFFGIVGRNGSGKSTLLKMIAGIYQPNKGKITVNGKLVPFIELGVGFNPELTGRENVYLNGALLGFSKKEVDVQYEKIVEFAELDKFMEQKLKNYSSGMQVRLAFSMAVRAKADVLLIDEVLAVGDADFQRKCFDYFRTLKKNEKTVIFVTHDMSAVREYCDRALFIEKSHVVKIGRPAEVAKLYTQLFMEEFDDINKVDADKKRFGNNDARVTSVKLDKTTYRAENDKFLNIAITIRANVDMEYDLNVGFLIKSISNVHIMGTNTHEQKQSIGKLKTGQSIEIIWEVPNIFSDGKYFIDIAATSSDGSINFDWWEEVVGFRVYREEYSPYAVNPKVNVVVKY